MPIIYVALGSNVGNREERVLQAVDQMKTFAKVNKISTLIETEAQGPNQGQPKFINGVVELDTTCSPEEVFHELLKSKKTSVVTPKKKAKINRAKLTWI
jgi:2-amino-4-hydroxy-6-hydroxymethyldihydropteridine diphosphokinase